MCRTTSNEYLPLHHHLGRLKITAFYLRLSVSSPTLLPDSLTLVINPRAASVHVNGSKVQPDSPGFISLHRVLSQDKYDAVFASKDRLRASEGFAFEVHAAQQRLFHGLFRRHDDSVVNASWRMECKYADGGMYGYVAREAEVSVVLEDGQVLKEKVTRPRRCRRRGFLVGLEDIPEERDEGFEPEECCCCCDEVVSSSQSDSDDEFDNSEDGDYQKEMEMEMEMELNEGVGWAVDVGIWVVCLGVGLLVSTASARKLRRRKLLR